MLLESATDCRLEQGGVRELILHPLLLVSLPWIGLQQALGPVLESLTMTSVRIASVKCSRSPLWIEMTCRTTGGRDRAPIARAQLGTGHLGQSDTRPEPRWRSGSKQGKRGEEKQGRWGETSARAWLQGLLAQHRIEEWRA